MAVGEGPIGRAKEDAEDEPGVTARAQEKDAEKGKDDGDFHLITQGPDSSVEDGVGGHEQLAREEGGSQRCLPGCLIEGGERKMRAVKDSAAYCRKGQCGDEGDVNAEGAADDVLRVGKLTATPYRKGEDVSAQNEEEDDGFATSDEGPEDPGWRMELADGPPVVTDDGYGGDSADCVELSDSSCGDFGGDSGPLRGRSHAFTILFATYGLAVGVRISMRGP